MSEKNSSGDRRHDLEQDKRISRLETEITRWRQTLRTLRAMYCVIGGLVATAYVVLQLLRLLGWLPVGGE